jgi:hypothetical protein
MSAHMDHFKATPELLEGLVGPLAGPLRPPRLRTAKVLLPIDMEDGSTTHADKAWVAAFLRALSGYPGLHIETYPQHPWDFKNKHTPWRER